MNHKNMTLAIAAIVAAVAMTAVAFAMTATGIRYTPQQRHNNSNRIDVSQDISQDNVCSNSTCLNDASNSADIHR